MEIKTYLAEFGRKIEKEFDDFFRQEVEEAGSISATCRQGAERFRRYLKGGKMARGGLVNLGYLLAGKTANRAIVKAAAAVEIIHSFLLVHDDWIDRDLTRRGKPTVHAAYGTDFGRGRHRGDGDHWAASMAVVLGDLGCFWGFKLLSTAGFSADRTVAATSLFSEALIKTGWGELDEIGYDAMPGLAWRRIVRIRELKTAFYTLVMPLQVGLTLAGGQESRLEAAESYGLPVGLAFQLHDDYLGFFGDEAKTGKSASCDLKEGKKTLLMAKAFACLAAADRNELAGYLGRSDLKPEEIERARRLVVKSGAVEANRRLALKMAAKGKQAIEKLTKDKKLAALLSQLADYLVTREK